MKLPRVGPDLARARKTVGAQRNQSTLASPVFLKACALAKVTPTKRQASKWNNSHGAAHTERFNARRLP